MNKVFFKPKSMMWLLILSFVLNGCAKDSDIFYQSIEDEVAENVKPGETDPEDVDAPEDENPDEGQIPDEPKGGEPNKDGTVSTELKAFPSAYGAGAFVTGGRGKPVYKVTNLNDSGSGSFRQAISNAGRTDGGIIVFDVSGTIDLKSWLTISVNNLTIAGQTAPEGGITITGTRFRADRCNNVIMRYIRIRPTYTGEDAFEWISCYNVIVDHVSVTWGGDEAISTRAYSGMPVYNFTMQRMLIAESKTGTLFGDSTNPSLAHDLSFHNSLFFNISHRVPNINATGRADVINNVTWNWQSRLTFVNGDSKLNHINNYYGTGMKSRIGDARNKAQQYNKHEIYTFGNFVDKGLFGLSDNNRDLWDEFNRGQGGTDLGSQHFVDNAFSLLGAPLPIMSAQDAFVDVVNDSGANRYISDNGNVIVYRDFIDDEYVKVIKGGEGSYIQYENSPETFTSERRYIEFHDSVSSTPLATRDSNYDADGDGMADVWEKANGMDPTIDDSNGDVDGDGYTNIEEFINMVDF